LIKTPERRLLSRATDSTITLEFMKILHLSTYIMETRRNRNEMMFQMKRKSQIDIMVLDLLFHVNFVKEIIILRQSRNTTSYIRYSCCEN
jgi:hypothetical protein